MSPKFNGWVAQAPFRLVPTRQINFGPWFGNVASLVASSSPYATKKKPGCSLPSLWRHLAARLTFTQLL